MRNSFLVPKSAHPLASPSSILQGDFALHPEPATNEWRLPTLKAFKLRFIALCIMFLFSFFGLIKAQTPIPPVDPRPTCNIQVGDVVIADNTDASSLSVSSISSQRVLIEGLFIVDINFTFNSCIIVMAPGAEIRLIIHSGSLYGAILTISESQVTACDQGSGVSDMWLSINTTHPGNRVNIYSSLIQDGQIGLDLVDNTTCDIQNSTFEWNRQHIRMTNLDATTLPSIPAPSIIGSHFRCSAWNSSWFPLLPPFAGIRTLDGILLQDCIGVKIGQEGSTSSAFTNYFYNAERGIFVENGNIWIEIVNNNFSRLVDNTAITGFGGIQCAVGGNSTVNSEYGIKFGGNSTSTTRWHNEVDSCEYGIYLNADFYLQARENIFTNIEKNGLTVRNVNGMDTHTFEVIENSFTDVALASPGNIFSAINFNQIENTNVTITSNILNMTTALTTVNPSTGNCYTVAQGMTNRGIELENTILFSSGYQVYVANNDITNYSSGIFAKGVSSTSATILKIISNTVTAPNQECVYGIEVSTGCDYADIRNNILDVPTYLSSTSSANENRGLYIKDNDFLTVHCNEIYKFHRGIVVNGFSGGTTWSDASETVPLGMWGNKLDNTKFGILFQSSTAVGMQGWYVSDVPSDNQWSNHQGTYWVYVPSTAATQSFHSRTTGNYNLTSGNTNNITLSPSSYTGSDFCDGGGNLVGGNGNSAMMASSENYDWATDNAMNVEALYGKEIAYPGTVRFDHVSAELLQKVQDLYSIDALVATGEMGSAESNAVALKEATSGFLHYMAIVKEISIRVKQRDAYFLSNEEIETLFAIATLCPETGGKAIRLAQLLLYPYYPDEEVFLPCINTTDNGAARMANVKHEMYHITVYPNPANKLWVIQMPDESKEVYTVQLMDLVSQQVKINQTLSSGQNTLQIEHLPSGVYFYKIEKAGQFLETGKLTIVH